MIQTYIGIIIIDLTSSAIVERPCHAEDVDCNEFAQDGHSHVTPYSLNGYNAHSTYKSLQLWHRAWTVPPPFWEGVVNGGGEKGWFQYRLPF